MCLVSRFLTVVALSLSLLAARAVAEVSVSGDRATVRAEQTEAVVRGGTVVSLVNRATGESYLDAAGATALSGLQFVDQRVEAADKARPSASAAGATAALVEEGFGSGDRLETQVKPDPQTGDLVLSQTAKSSAKGVAEVRWGVAGVRGDLRILLPGGGGRRVGLASNYGRYDWPINWECGMIVVQGEKGGFWLWADDPDCAHFKAVEIRPRDGKFDLILASQNPAPFEDLDSAKSCPWHLAVYTGDWRVPARRYRDWMARVWSLHTSAEQQPAWVKDIRFVCLVGMELDVLDALAQTVDPKATLLYVPGWRRDGYDRNYPDYTALPEFAPFVKRAHELGYHVMPHANYFGCDPKNELYAKFEPFQLTDPYSKEKLWWTWDRADPPIKFAYINPACKEFRQLLISRLVAAQRAYGFDAVHLDQTLCIWNDHHGLLDGLNCAQGSRLLHRELRAALPELALSGEGLDEVTTQSEAFAQHHALGINFVEGSWDENAIASAHPIRSYLLGPFTQTYGYLGMTSPTNGQLYAAWRDSYKHYGVLPTLAWPTVNVLHDRPAFVGQVLDEAKSFVAHQVSPDLDREWPADVFFPYRTADGRRVTYASDGHGGTIMAAREAAGQSRVITRTLHGVSSVELPGTIADWRVYDDRRLFGLRPEAWYAYSDQPRDPKAFHLTALPEDLAPAALVLRDELALLSFVRQEPASGNLLTQLAQADTGVRKYDGTEVRQKGPLNSSPDLQAHFIQAGAAFNVHPPWGAGAQGAAALGTTFAEFRLRVPKGPQPVFDSTVFIDPAAVGKSDGVRFKVIARGPGGQKEASVATAVAEPKPLRLDLKDFAGQEITLALEVDGGEARRADFDWARWSRPRVLCEGSEEAGLAVVCPWTPQQTISGAGEGRLTPEAGRPNAYRMTALLPGSVFLLRQAAALVSLPLDLTAAKYVFFAQTYAGTDATDAQYVAASSAPATCGGQAKPALNMHPANQGVSRCDFAIRLPDQPAALTGFTGIREGSKSTGVRFLVEVNGTVLFNRLVLPSRWDPLSVDLAAFRGKPVVLTLKVDSEGPFDYDWAAWGEPKVTAGDR